MPDFGSSHLGRRLCGKQGSAGRNSAIYALDYPFCHCFRRVGGICSGTARVHRQTGFSHDYGDRVCRSDNFDWRAVFGDQAFDGAHGSADYRPSPAFIALFAVWLLKERIHKLQLAGILLATIGVLIVIGIPDEADAQSSLLGNLILLVAAVSWGLYTVMSKKATLRYSSLAVTTYVALFGLIFTCPVMVWELSVTAVSWDFSWKIWAGVLYIGIISTAGAFYLWNKGFELLQAGSGAGFFFVQPIVGAALGWLLLGEHLGIGFFAGAIFIFLGVALSNLQQSAAKQKAGTPD